MAPSSQALALKQEIESRLAHRVPAALSPRPRDIRKLQSIGVDEIDTLLGGGLPVGAISEFTGPAGSGRTTLAMSLLRTVSQLSACAFIDVGRSLDVEGAAANGVSMRNLLWVSISESTQSRPAPQQPVDPPQAPPSDKLPTRRHHSREEARGIGPALNDLLVQSSQRRLKKAQGTPGYPNRPLGLVDAPDELVSYARLHQRSADADDPLRKMDLAAADAARRQSEALRKPLPSQKAQSKPWAQLDKAIRATDQILQAGGFRAIVLNLALVAPEQALRIPAATWFRFRRAALESDAVLLLLTQVPCARSSASAVLECVLPPIHSSNCCLLNSISYQAQIARQRVADPCTKKAPGRAATWHASPQWMHSVGR